jgi:hypothetical protein
VIRNIENRLRKLELKMELHERQSCRAVGWVTEHLPTERIQNLAANERVVVDWFRDCGGFVPGRQRISTDPADQGRHCEEGGYLLDVIQELHQTCSYRERSGSCSYCEGTPVAEDAPQEPLRDSCFGSID